MQLPEESIKEFKNIYKKEFGILLSDEEAEEQAVSFLDFMSLVTKPIDKRTMRSFKIKKEVV